MKLKYAIQRDDGQYVKYSELGERFTPDLDRASLWEFKHIKTQLSDLSRDGYAVVPVEIQRVAKIPKPADEILDEELAKIQINFDCLNTQAETDIDAMSEKDFKQWRRMKRMLEDRFIDFGGLG